MVRFLLIMVCLKEEDTFNKRTERKKHGSWSEDTDKGKPCPQISTGHFSHLSNLIVIESDVNFETPEMGKWKGLFYLASYLQVSGIRPGYPIRNAGLSGQTFGEEGPYQAELLSHFRFAQLCFRDPAPSSC